MSDEKFKLPQSSYEELAKIIRAYGHFNEPTDLGAISQASALHSTIVSRNNGFLIGVGVLEGGQKKALTPLGRQLARALDHNIEEEIAAQWRDVVVSNEFLQKIVSAIRIRSGMEASSLQSHIAYSAGLNKTSGVMTGTRTVIDMMMLAGVLREIDGKIQVALIEPRGVSSPSDPDAMEASREERIVGSVLVPSQSYSPTRPPRTRPGSHEQAPDITINIEVRIQCTPAEVDGLGTKLRGLLDDIAKRPLDSVE
jgi:hypothetical protein